jgi:CHAT domain-containing protein
MESWITSHWPILRCGALICALVIAALSCSRCGEEAGRKRVIEPRLSGEWIYKPTAPADAVRRAAGIPPRASGEKSQRSAAPLLPNSLTARDAITLLLTGDSLDAVDILTAVASQSHDADVFNDLSAALLVRADEPDEADAAVDALAAADRALAIDPRFEPALFNRALALSRMGLNWESRQAWSRYLEVDRSSPWADEALQRMHALDPLTKVEAWTRLLSSARDLPPEREPAVIGDLAGQYPEQARMWGEGEWMHDWAIAELSSDHAAAALSLARIKAVANRLRQSSGEILLYDVAGAMDGAGADGRSEALARAERIYWEGRDLYRVNRAADAEQKFREAEIAFRACGSPMAYLARYQTGSALYAQHKLKQAGELLDALANEHLDLRGYKALDATIGWERGACLLERGAISAAMDVFVRSRDSSLKLGELYVPAVMDAYLASAFDYAGDEAAAWTARRRAFQGLSRVGSRYRLLVAVGAAAAAGVRAGKWDRALSLLDMTAAEAERQRKALVAVEAFTLRARVHVERQALDAARLDESAARKWAALLEDESARTRAEANLAFVDGLSLRADDPRGAAVRFTAALDYFQRVERRVEMPRIYLALANTHDVLGDLAAARADLEAGMVCVESERRQILDLGQRATLMAGSNQLFAKAVELAMRVGDGEAAFELSERHRARALTEMFELGSGPTAAEVEPIPLADIQAALAPDAAIVEYAFIGNKLFTFVVRRDSFQATTTPIEREPLMAIVQAAHETVRSGGDVTAALSAADAVLLQPVRTALEGVRHVAVSPDEFVSGVPFAALYDSRRGRFLVEDASVTIAPSAALTLSASRRAHRGGRPSILSIAGDAFDAERYPSASSLDRAATEAADVASSYATSQVLTARQASVDSVRVALSRYDIAHFAAHGVAMKPVNHTALLLAPSGGQGGELRVSDIVRLDLRRTSVAVLAACSSAAPTSRSDGADNLALAFIAAGVPTAIASLTDLDDEVAAPLMAMLHRHLSAGTDPSDAVREIALEELRDRRRTIRQPLRWSNIVAVGGSSGLLAEGRESNR